MASTSPHRSKSKVSQGDSSRHTRMSAFEVSWALIERGGVRRGDPGDLEAGLVKAKKGTRTRGRGESRPQGHLTPCGSSRQGRIRDTCGVPRFGSQSRWGDGSWRRSASPGKIGIQADPVPACRPSSQVRARADGQLEWGGGSFDRSNSPDCEFSVAIRGSGIPRHSTAPRAESPRGKGSHVRLGRGHRTHFLTRSRCRRR